LDLKRIATVGGREKMERVQRRSLWILGALWCMGVSCVLVTWLVGNHNQESLDAPKVGEAADALVERLGQPRLIEEGPGYRVVSWLLSRDGYFVQYTVTMENGLACHVVTATR
jgi:hypothetical protein